MIPRELCRPEKRDFAVYKRPETFLRLHIYPAQGHTAMETDQCSNFPDLATGDVEAGWTKQKVDWETSGRLPLPRR